eukprot:6428588-Prymnesium_polylepis.1
MARWSQRTASASCPPRALRKSTCTQNWRPRSRSFACTPRRWGRVSATNHCHCSSPGHRRWSASTANWSRSRRCAEASCSRQPWCTPGQRGQGAPPSSGCRRSAREQKARARASSDATRVVVAATPAGPVMSTATGSCSLPTYHGTRLV